MEAVTFTRDQWYVIASAINHSRLGSAESPIARHIVKCVVQGLPNQDDENLDEEVTITMTQDEAHLVRLFANAELS